MQIELQNVKKVYPVTGGEVVALDNISLKIRKGDIFGIIGLSGAGKSTLIRCVNRLDTPTEGKILIDGQNVPDMNKQQLRQMRRKVSMIFQQFNLLMQQTVAKNIAYPMECIGVPRAKINARVKELLEVVGLESKAKAYPACCKKSTGRWASPSSLSPTKWQLSVKSAPTSRFSTAV